MKEVITARRKRKKGDGIEPYLYLIPSLVLFGAFIYYPFLKTIYLSVSMTNVRGKVIDFVGLENYVEVLTSTEFMNSILTTFKFVVLVGAPSIILGLILALLASTKIKGSRIYELMFSAPMAIASAPAAIVWMMIFHPTNGILNYLVQKEVGWLTDPKIAIFSVALVTVWLNLGVNFIFLLTGLRNIPEELVESASVDGANYIQKLFKIILPMLSPQLFFRIIYELNFFISSIWAD